MFKFEAIPRKVESVASKFPVALRDVIEKLKKYGRQAAFVAFASFITACGSKEGKVPKTIERQNFDAKELQVVRDDFLTMKEASELQTFEDANSIPLEKLQKIVDEGLVRQMAKHPMSSIDQPNSKMHGKINDDGSYVISLENDAGELGFTYEGDINHTLIEQFTFTPNDVVEYRYYDEATKWSPKYESDYMKQTVLIHVTFDQETGVILNAWKNEPEAKKGEDSYIVRAHDGKVHVEGNPNVVKEVKDVMKYSVERLVKLADMYPKYIRDEKKLNEQLHEEWLNQSGE